MDTNRLRELAGLNEETLTEAFDANGMLGDMKEIAEEFKADRKGVRDILRSMAKDNPKEAKIAGDFLTDLLGTIFANQEG